MKMKRTILVVISCLLLLSLLAIVLPGCTTGTTRVVGNGTRLCVFPDNGSTLPGALAYRWTGTSNYIAFAFLGINWTTVQYNGTTAGYIHIPDWMSGNWSTW